jgi:hypothetical protein
MAVGRGSLKAHGLDSLSWKVGLLLADKARLSKMSEAGRAAGRPETAAAVVRAMFERADRA